jgi:hypothetical protein
MSGAVEYGSLRNSKYDDVTGGSHDVGRGGIFEMADGVGAVPVFCDCEAIRQKLFFENQGRFQ